MGCQKIAVGIGGRSLVLCGGGAVAGRVSCFLPGIHQGLQDAGGPAPRLPTGAPLDFMRFLAQANISPDGSRHSGCFQSNLLTAAPGQLS